MPYYEYECECGNRFDIERPIGQAPETCRCERCGKPAPRRYGVPEVQYTVEGFSATEYLSSEHNSERWRR